MDFRRKKPPHSNDRWMVLGKRSMDRFSLTTYSRNTVETPDQYTHTLDVDGGSIVL